MKETVTLAKEGYAKKDFSLTMSDRSVHRVRDEPERQLGSLRGVIDSIRRVGGTPSVESIATELSGMHTAQRAPVLMALQRTRGNQYVQRVVSGIQAKLKIGQPWDIHEQEADRVADAVMRMPEPKVQRQAEEEKKKEEELIMAKGISGKAPEVSDNLQARLNQSKGGAQPLPESERNFFEPRFGRDFSQVLIHNDSGAAESARALNAHAFTIGRDIVFGTGKYEPGTTAGKRLLAHELTHVVQQSSRRIQAAQLNEKQTIEVAKKQTDAGVAKDGMSLPERSAQQVQLQSITPIVPTLQRNNTGNQEEGPSVQVGESTPVIWFKFNSTELRQDAKVDSITHFALTLSRIRQHLADTGDAGRIILQGYASSEGTEADNLTLSQKRADRIKNLLIATGISKDRITSIGHGPDNSFPGLEWNRRVEVELTPLVTRINMPPLEISVRKITPGEQSLLERLAGLGNVAKKEGTGGAEFKLAIGDFKNTLKKRLMALGAGEPLPHDLQLIMKALMLWSTDPGNQWGEGIWDSKNLVMSAPDYATVPASQCKCNAYVAEVIYQAFGIVHRAHKSEEEKGKYFPYRASEWGDPNRTIPNFVVVNKPQMSDIWSNGSHTGIYLGAYSGKKLYISARDDGSGVFGLEKVQHKHGIQIKYLPDGGVYRRYKP